MEKRFIDPLSTDEFEDALRKGLGRTILCVQRHGDSAYRDWILDACLHYRQVSGFFDEYLFDLIRCGGDAKPLVNILVETLPGMTDDDSDPSQVVAILRRFAVGGHAGARNAVMDAFNRDSAHGGVEYLEDLLLVEGVDGLVHVAESLPADNFPEEERWRVRSAVDQLAERDGETITAEAVRMLAIRNYKVATLVAFVDEDRQRLKRLRRKPRQGQPDAEYAQFTANLDTVVRRGREAVLTYAFLPIRLYSDETVGRLARDLIDETTPLRQLGLLRAFRHRRFPIDHNALLAYVDSGDSAVRESALRALAQVSHDDVRALALACAKNGTRSDLVAELLVHNSMAGDEALFLDLSRRKMDPDIMHWLTLDLRKVLETNPELKRAAICVELYERGFCSMCRCGVVELWKSQSVLPQWMNEEIRWDAYSETRGLGAAE